MDAQIARIAADHHGVFAGHHLDDLDVSHKFREARIRDGRWVRIHHSVFRIAGAPVTWRGKLQGACWAGGTRAAASHRSAAELLELPAGRQNVVEISCPRWHRARHEGLVVHETTLLEPIDLTFIDGIPCTTAARTIFDLARRATPRSLDLDIDAALRRGGTSTEELVATAARLASKGRPGARRFKAVLAARALDGAVPESPPERLLASYLVDRGLPHPVAQHVIVDRLGGFVARVDLAYPDVRLAIEYESFEHHVGKVALVRDSARRNAIVACGYTVLSATAADLADRGERIAGIVRQLFERAAREPLTHEVASQMRLLGAFPTQPG